MNELDRYKDALSRIAEEQKVYLGHGDYDTLPMLSAEEAQSLARDALMGTGPYRTTLPYDWDAPASVDLPPPIWAAEHKVEQAARIADASFVDETHLVGEQRESPWLLPLMCFGGLIAIGLGSFVRWMMP